jgi:hypothetical protein
MAHGTGRRVLTNDLPFVILRVLESSQEINRLPVPIEEAIWRRKLPRLVAKRQAFPWLSWIIPHENPGWTELSTG